MPPATTLSAEQPRDAAADSTGVVFRKHDRRRQDEVGGHHLAATDVRVVAQFAAGGQCRSCIMFRMPAPRSTTMKQFDC